jgi:hypothetical protein
MPAATAIAAHIEAIAFDGDFSKFSAAGSSSTGAALNAGGAYDMETSQ